MTLKAFTSNCKDNSTDAGFQFTFYCDICRDGYKSRFIESKTYKRKNRMRGLSRIAAIGASMAGQHRVSSGMRQGGHMMGTHSGKSPEWHKEFEKAFGEAQNEAKGHFTRCPKCYKWVCATDWNEQSGLCVQCAPRVNVEVQAARAGRMAQDIAAKAATTQVFTGEIDERATICHQCNKPAGEGKFCSNCGANMSLVKCEKCGTESAPGIRFCGQCGNNLE